MHKRTTNLYRGDIGWPTLPVCIYCSAATPQQRLWPDSPRNRRSLTLGKMPAWAVLTSIQGRFPHLLLRP